MTRQRSSTFPLPPACSGSPHCTEDSLRPKIARTHLSFRSCNFPSSIQARETKNSRIMTMIAQDLDQPDTSDRCQLQRCKQGAPVEKSSPCAEPHQRISKGFDKRRIGVPVGVGHQMASQASACFRMKRPVAAAASGRTRRISQVQVVSPLFVLKTWRPPCPVRSSQPTDFTLESVRQLQELEVQELI
jgi:hypothetical protein